MRPPSHLNQLRHVPDFLRFRLLSLFFASSARHRLSLSAQTLLLNACCFCTELKSKNQPHQQKSTNCVSPRSCICKPLSQPTQRETTAEVPVCGWLVGCGQTQGTGIACVPAGDARVAGSVCGDTCRDKNSWIKLLTYKQMDHWTHLKVT